nr:hypothetical protein BCT96_11420 [Vibrio splendidus]
MLTKFIETECVVIPRRIPKGSLASHFISYAIFNRAKEQKSCDLTPIYDWEVGRYRPLIFRDITLRS